MREGGEGGREGVSQGGRKRGRKGGSVNDSNYYCCHVLNVFRCTA